MMTHCYTAVAARLASMVHDELRQRCGTLRPRRILVKPNWVLHATDPAFPIDALVTDARLIRAVLDACLELFPEAESILVGDCPLQSADWSALREQSGLGALQSHYAARVPGRVHFRDLRREVYQREGGSFLAPARSDAGDERGYREVHLGARSHLEEISQDAARFAVNDYSAAVTRSNHRPGDHRYLVCQSVLDADLFINLPKWKCHAKAGLTAALKNLVGINGDKAYLPHFRRGAPKWGGDEYQDQGRWLYWAQTRTREAVQKRSRLAYRLLRPCWQLIKRWRGIETRLDDRAARPRRFYAAGGAWYGNQTIWRMIYDLNWIVQCADANGRLQPTPQRHYVCFVDGLIAGEGNGPLEPLPRSTDWLIAGNDPFAIDTALCWFMGFDPEKLPVTARHASYLGPEWGRFDRTSLRVALDGTATRLRDSEVNLHFVPPPGWRDHIER
jgi:uncharacterized protein (DUF362 family)